MELEEGRFECIDDFDVESDEAIIEKISHTLVTVFLYDEQLLLLGLSKAI